MTAHPIDTEALREQYGHLVEKYGPEAWAESRAHVVLTVLDALAAAEHRATRAEAQSETRRINGEYWQGAARGNAITADVWKESAEEAEARAKAVRDVLDRHAHYGLVEADDIRRALDGGA